MLIAEAAIGKSTLRHLLGRPHLRFLKLRLMSLEATPGSRSSASLPSAKAQGSSNLDPPDVRKLAKLAQIRVTDEEVADWEPKIQETIKWFDQLQKIDVEGVEPCTRSSLANLLAAGKDIPAEFQNREALLESVPEREGPYVKVPKIL